MQHKIRPGISPKPKLAHKLIGAIKLSQLIQLSETNFSNLIQNIETRPLFLRLAYPENKKEKVISYQGFARAKTFLHYLELKEHLLSISDNSSLGNLFIKHKKVLPVIEKIGESNFKEYFLYNEEQLSLNQVAGRCRITPEDARKIGKLLDDISIHNELIYPSAFVDKWSRLQYTKIAYIEKVEHCRDTQPTAYEFVINFFSPYYAHGKYLIDYKKLDDLKAGGVFNEDELESVDALLSKIELINFRKTRLYRIITELIERQRAYFISGDLADLIPFSEKQLAIEENINLSSVSRLIHHRSIVTPRGEEKTLKDFFVSRKTWIKQMIKNMLPDDRAPHYPDSKLRDEIKGKYSVNLSRRSIADYRKELKIPPFVPTEPTSVPKEPTVGS
ncbi:MAG: hypothetical protein COY53_06035 [Elusimicrobia bacterium CG_4_10_14_0_8_um_filter_37_32]|nr:MAG: hypothetical protein COS17_02520 [Elusimicrobia bacterium CG02_land_8_20_14_3_00_37_13]PIZ13214.1 MAG: hypothetical protein COY53_06035 [Elusimicrobia bacterium CG_4_10_14_0_8_um_filter_37_32]